MCSIGYVIEAVLIFPTAQIALKTLLPIVSDLALEIALSSFFTEKHAEARISTDRILVCRCGKWRLGATFEMYVGTYSHWWIQGAANRIKVSQWPGQEPFWPPPFKSDIVLKTVFSRANATVFNEMAGFGPSLAKWLDPPVLIGTLIDK